MAEGRTSRLATRARLVVQRARADERGAVGLMFAFMIPMVVAVAGVSVDYASLSAQRTKLQAVADASALAAAREFRLGNANVQTLNQAATAYAGGSLAGQNLTATITPSIDLNKRSITVALALEAPTLLMHYVGTNAARIEVVATARMVGGAPICVIGLDATANATVEIEQSAKLEATGCSVYSNSTKPNGLVARQNGTIRAAFICSAGGKSSPGPGSYSPTPQTDCPIIPDPLLPRALPGSGGCLRNNASYNGGFVYLVPGTYCGGAKFDGGAKVSLAPGTYVFRDGPLVVTGGSSFTGTNVALHFAGKDAQLNFTANSSISLTAPRSGTMAGILISEDRNNSSSLLHQIMSDDARTLLGTIYLPSGRLHVGANKPVADQSAYTI
ncbi:MAG: pilus assembly protein TadG-related protein, partial [Hyphomicrobiales bacterium]|nr:pilus assembly protein TadG-related protein [Hyphomicrobiales bacterium]